MKPSPVTESPSTLVETSTMNTNQITDSTPATIVA